MFKSSKIPSTPKAYTINFPNLDGGLNLWKLPYDMNANESPDMLNMWWKDGALRCRNGQSYIYDTSLGVGYAAYEGTFWDKAFMHIGNKIYYCTPSADTVTLTELCDLSVLYSGYTPSRGTFLRYGDNLYYKANGVYVEIAWTGSAFTASNVTAYTPVILINGVPASGTGNLYQPENRISPSKIVWYTAQTEDSTESFTATPSQTEFTFTTDGINNATAMTIDGVASTEFTYESGVATYTGDELTGGEDVKFDIDVWAHVYQLPVDDIDSLTSVVVDGSTKVVSTDYTVNLTDGTVTFLTGKYPTYSADNQVIITYSKANTDAYNSVMSCHYAIVFGGDTELCIVVGGCSAQPNAYFWNGNNVVMDPGYFPMEHYNLAGDTEEYITGFGKQQDSMIIFKENSISKADMCTVDINDRAFIEMNCTKVNSSIGCDLPYSIQLIENYLVFCNSKRGIFYIKNASSSYETNIEMISKNVNGTSTNGLLYDIAQSSGAVYSTDDDTHYWLIANGHAYVWDYELSAYAKPSWFYFTNIAAIAFFRDASTLYHMNTLGKLTKFIDSFADYGAAINKYYVFAAQHFGTYQRFKDIVSVIITTSSATSTVMALTYTTDYGTYTDATPITSGAETYAKVAVRKPGLKHIRHFSMKLANSTVSKDMTIMSAQVSYKYTGKER